MTSVGGVGRPRARVRPGVATQRRFRWISNAVGLARDWSLDDVRYAASFRSLFPEWSLACSRILRDPNHLLIRFPLASTKRSFQLQYGFLLRLGKQDRDR